MTDATALEASILENPDDPAPYLVYADWLQSRGDPRGELIVMQSRGDSGEAYLAQHPELAGPSATFIADPSQRRGKSITVTWKHGFIHTLDIGWGMYTRGGTRAKATEELTAILAHPSCRFLRELSVGPMPSDDQMSFDGAVDAIEAAPPVALRSLYMGKISDWDISSTDSGDFARVAKVCRRLEAVTLQGGSISIGEIDLPHLRSFEVKTGSLDQQSLRDIVAMAAPNLESLSIYFGQTNYGGDCTIESVHPLLARAWPKLKHLGIVNCPFVDLSIEPLAKSPLLAQLRTLDLSMGALTDEGVQTLVKHADAFRHLESIDVSDNALTEDSRAPLAAFTPSIELTAEQDPDRADPDTDINDRWTTVGE